MKKRRGLRRYYRKLGDSSFIDNLDFSGSLDSWFDLYHIHVDNTGLGNKSWKSRKQHLDALFQIANVLEERLKSFPKEFQYWILISEVNSNEDSIYIHTQNPNGTEFPAEVGFENKNKVKDTILRDYLSTKNYKIDEKVVYYYEEPEELNYLLTKENIGLKVK